MPSVVRHRLVTIVVVGPQQQLVDAAGLKRLQDVLLEQADVAHPPLLVLDFSDAGFLGSHIIEIVVRTWKRVCQRRGQMALCHLNDFSQEVLERTQLNRLWTVYPTRLDACTALAGE